MTYKEKRRFASNVSRISAALGLETSVVLHFINGDLDRIYRERVQAHQLRLQELDAEIQRTRGDEAVLAAELKKKERLLTEASSHLARLCTSLSTKSESLDETLKEVDKLRSRLAEVDASLRDTERTRSQLEYDLMMKTHRQRERHDASARANRIFLAILSLLAVAIAAALVWKLL